MTILGHQKGASLIAAIFIIVILGFMGVMFVSMIGTSALMAVNDLQAAQALAIAEGGLQFALKNGAFCTYATTTTLGDGTFTISSQLTSTTLFSGLTSTATTVSVGATTGFVLPGAIQVASDYGTEYASEYIYCSGASGGSFTGCARPWAGSTPEAHTSGAAVTQCIVTSTGTVGNAGRSVQAIVGQ